MNFSLFLLQNVARPGPGGPGLQRVLLWLGVLIAVTLVGGVLVMWYRRRVLGQEGQEDPGSFMDELRRARDAGEMSQVEFDAAKRMMVTKMRGRAAANPAIDPGHVRSASRFGFHDAVTDQEEESEQSSPESADGEPRDGV